MEDAVSRGKKSFRKNQVCNDEEEAEKCAAIEKLPTYERLRSTVMEFVVEESGKKLVSKDADPWKLDLNDNVEIQLPAVEIRFEGLTIEANCYMGSRALPTLPNAARNYAESAIGLLGIRLAKMSKLTILKDVSGIIKPSRMALLLGPPSSGKTTLLTALAGKFDPSLKVTGEVTYNGYRLNEFVPQKTSAYISQNDVHIGEMTVKETLEFSARCQGVDTRYDLLSELARKNKKSGVFPEAELDLFAEATKLEEEKCSLVTDYTLKILGLDICENTIVGNEMHRGISGGQKKRVTTGEMIVGPTKTWFMDEISTGLDSCTTYEIVKYLQQVVHQTQGTVLMSLLQPTPETFDLFDDVILLSEGQIIYQGPREQVLEFFEHCGFRCPAERKGTADFLQEVTSRKDQEQYWEERDKTYRYISVSEFASKFKEFHVGVHLQKELSLPFNKTSENKASLVFKTFSVPKLELLKACLNKEWLLIKRFSFFYLFRTVKTIAMAIIASTVFLRTEMHTSNEEDGAVYLGALMFAVIVHTLNSFAELPLNIARLPVFYKQRDLLFHPPWTFTLPHAILAIPLSLLESVVWVCITYYTIGFAPEASRFLKHLLAVFMIQQMAGGLFKCFAGICRTMINASTGGPLVFLIFFQLGGFVIPEGQIPKWLSWGYWVSPLKYAFEALAVNEMLAPRWMNNLASDKTTGLGVAVLKSFDVSPSKNRYWIGVGALLGFALLFNIIFTLALMYLNPLGKPQATISEEAADNMAGEQGGSKAQPRVSRPKLQRDSLRRSLSSANGNDAKEVTMQRMSSTNFKGLSKGISALESFKGFAPQRGMVLPFTPCAMSFECVNYYVDMPPEMKEQGVTDDKLLLLSEVTGAFRPGVLTALMGVSGAGKTTLMDVLAGRKTGGYIEGDIRISGFPKKQDTFARISGYCEQNDIHSPQVTVRESLIYSAFLRLDNEVSDEDKMAFVDEVMDLVELDNLKDAIVGLPGVTGLSTEQRKRLTIAVELVANPSIIFMDEPTSGLDARAAAIVMRTVRNTVDTGRTVVCTIHQPSIDIFESFDELLLMKRGGQVIYAGPLGWNSHRIIEYFEAIPGVPKIGNKNPATWMLEVSSSAAEDKLGIDFAEHYLSSSLFERNKALVTKLSKAAPGATDLYFRTKYSQSAWGQFKTCIWKQWQSYWRSPDYNFMRFLFTLASALIVGAIFWEVGTKRDNSGTLTTIIGAMYVSVLFIGTNNCAAVQQVVANERTVFYRERAAGMYSSLPYALSMVICEIPYVLFQTTYYTLIVYSMVQFEWTARKFLWFFFISFISFLYFTYYGMMTVSVTPNIQVAGILASAFYTLFNLFSGFYVPRPKIPKWWIWYYWICPVAWTVHGLIASQYGDVEDRIRVPGLDHDPSIREYIQDHFGYDPDFLGSVAGILVGFAVFFAILFAFCLKTLNFQRR